MYLRVKFRSATGMYPTFGRDSDGSGHLRGDDVKSAYGNWLEHIFYDGNKERYLRSEFVKDTGEKSTVRNKSNLTTYTHNYILWLEEFVMKSKLFQLD